MTHEEASRLLDAYADGELDLVSSLAVKEHLGTCDDCTGALTNLRTLRDALSEAAPYYEAPAALEGRIRAAMRDSNRAETRRGLAVTNYGWVGAAIAAVLLITIVVSGVRSLAPKAGDLTAREVVDDHLRSLTANHLTDVLSSNQHTVKPWFDGRLNFTPPVIDLTAQGFPLLGGRLEYLDDRRVAAVVYRRREHVINLFISPAEPAADTRPQSQVRDGYNIVHWTKSGMSYWAVSSVSGSELEKFAQLVSEDSPPPTPAG
ncbi:MAG TPA: anti-sigma factor [Candidatus Binataceae bacterium]|nr:anti-sigma factor [Candidatus Binataceae bacterium]